MKEHKKLYKAGKRWVTATVLSVVAGLAMATTTHAATDTATPAVTISQSQPMTNQAGGQQSGPAPVAATTQANQAAAANSANYGHLDGYSLSTSDSYQYGHLSVSGWHASDASQSEPYHYYLVYDNTTNQELHRQKATSPVVTRTDVQRIYPNVVNSLKSGFTEKLYVPYENVARGDSLSVISRYSDDPVNGEGHHTDLWFGPLAIDNGNHANLDSVTVDNGRVSVSGWHATNKNYEHDHHLIIAYDVTQHREIARKIIDPGDGYRPDVAKAFPTIMDAANSGFKVSFNLDPAFLNDEVQFISRWSSAEDGNGANVDYWFAPQRLFANHGNYGHLDGYRLVTSKDPDDARLAVAGWHATNASMVEKHPYIIVFDNTLGKEIGRSPVNQPTTRNDVAQAYPGVYGSSKSGFDLAVDIPYSSVGHHISIVARYSDDAKNGEGHHTDLWFAPFTFDMGNYAHLDSATISNNQVHVSGWHATNQVAQGGVRRYHTIIVYDVTRGHEIARQRIDLDSAASQVVRNDVANAYPHVAIANLSGFKADFKLSPELAHDQIQFISRWSATADANENFVDYWFAPQTFSYHQPAPQPTPVPTPQPTQSVVGVGDGQGYLDRWGVYSMQERPDCLVINARGWRVSQYADSKPYHNLILWDNTTNQKWTEVGVSNPALISSHADFIVHRPDIVASYGGQYPDAINAGFLVNMLSSELPLGHDFSIISRYSTDENDSNPSDLVFHIGRIDRNMVRPFENNEWQ